MEEILLQAFARKRGNSSEKRRRRIRSVVRFCVGGFRVLLGVVYLRGESTSFWVPWALGCLNLGRVLVAVGGHGRVSENLDACMTYVICDFHYESR